jgi:Tol biopolymer transport system component/predicted Ser/Thr protein kinase
MAPTPDRWQRIEALYHSALELGPAARAAYLDNACGLDANLRREVESLLAEAATGSGLLDHPVAGLPAEPGTIALIPGTLLGPYQIEELIGEGGMGRVYRTRDTRLGRTVAIKTSSARFSQRFEREARAVAALNHPHICHLYDVGPDYLVMEYIEGLALKGPLPADQALKYAEQILDALDAAHRQGIVHRDLKPANILVSKQGIKLLDFGLALMKPGADDLTMTQTGAVMGTPAYMAPEQWEGSQADARSDIYSFGCVLYEMLTGKRAAQDRVPVAPPFEDVLRTCLEKDPDERWQSARELKHALRWAAAKSRDAPATAAPSQSRFLTAGWIAAGVLAAALAALSFLHFREAPPLEQTLRAAIATPEGMAHSFHSFAISPDGRNLVISATVNGKLQLWLRAMNGLQAQPIPLTEDATFPFWSPDSRFIGFFAGGKLKKVPAGGGSPQSLCDVPSSRGGSWNRDNVIVFSPANSGISIQRVPAAGGVPVDVTRTKGVQRYPVFLPDGRHFLYLKRDAVAADNGVYVSSVDGSENRRVLPDVSGAEFAPAGNGKRAGHILFVRENTLMAAPFDPVGAQITGEVFPVADGVSLTTPSTYLPVTVSAGGVLIYEHTKPGSAASQFGWYDRTGKLLALAGAPGKVSNPAISPDGKLVAFQRENNTGSDLWVLELSRGVETRFTSDPSSNLAPIWSPAGDSIVFASNRSGVYNLYQKAANGSGREVLLLSNIVTDSPEQWSRDGRFIVYFELDTKNKRGLWILPAEAGTTDRKPIPFLRSEFDELLGQLSPDSHWIAFTSDRSGRREVYVRPFPRGDGEWTISIAGGQAARWRGDGKELFFEAADGKMTAVPVKKAVPGANAVFEPGTPLALFDAHMVHSAQAFSAEARYFEYDVTADGNRFLINSANSTGAASEPTLTVVTNWLAAVRK